MEELKPCPFCGRELDIEDPDTLYPNGIGWKLRELGQLKGFKSYHNFREVPREQWCYSVHCSNACGAELSADTAEEAIAKWNSRV